MVDSQRDTGSELVESIRLMVTSLSPDDVSVVASGLKHALSGDWNGIHLMLRTSLPGPRHRRLVEELLSIWERNHPKIPPEAVSLALQAVSHEHLASSRRQRVELVWSGPDSNAVPFRRTDQALLQLINHAQKDLLVVAFAVYRVANVLESLAKAVDRGVNLRLVIESPEESGGKVSHDGFQALGTRVTERASVYVWPRERRSTDAQGRHGSLHVKCAVADDVEMIVSSANLTEYALLLNMEMGLLVRGGPIAKRTRLHFDGLIDSGILARLV